MSLTIGRMKSLISPSFSLLSLSNLSKPPKNCFPVLQNPNLLSTGCSCAMFSLRHNASSNSRRDVRSYHQQPSSSSSTSGEIHVIVGPMFAGKTTTLLRRIQSESRNGSFQAVLPKMSCLLLDKTLKDLCYSGRLKEAIGLLWRTGVAVDWRTYALLLQECIHRGVYEWGKRIHAHMVVVGFVLNEYLLIKLLILYAKAGQLGTAWILFDKLPEKSLISWNAMIAGHVQKGLEDVGLSLYYQMRRNGVTPDQFTFASLLRACATLALLGQGKLAHGITIKFGIRQNIVVNSALMDLYFKCSSPSDGYQVFSESPDKNVITWTALISGYGQNGRFLEVLKLFHKMIEEGLRPNYVTFIAVLSACSHGGLVDEGWKYFLSMKNDYGIQPHGKHYAAMVDILGRAGKLEEAYEFINSSPCKDNAVLWGSLLGACRIHGNVKLLKLSAEKLFELEPENSGKYVVLSNTYATYGLWENVAEVRGLMRDFGVKKDPGYSRIEIQNEIHYFFKGDNTHTEAENTYKMLKELTCVLMDNGYVPDLSSE